jgi:hypothetical protein
MAETTTRIRHCLDGTVFPLADGIRTFRVSRMSAVKANAKSPKTPDSQVPADFRLRDYLCRKDHFEIIDTGISYSPSCG